MNKTCFWENQRFYFYLVCAFGYDAASASLKISSIMTKVFLRKAQFPYKSSAIKDTALHSLSG